MTLHLYICIVWSTQKWVWFNCSWNLTASRTPSGEQQNLAETGKKYRVLQTSPWRSTSSEVLSQINMHMGSLYLLLLCCWSSSQTSLVFDPHMNSFHTTKQPPNDGSSPGSISRCGPRDADIARLWSVTSIEAELEKLCSACCQQ